MAFIPDTSNFLAFQPLGPNGLFGDSSGLVHYQTLGADVLSATCNVAIFASRQELEKEEQLEVRLKKLRDFASVHRWQVCVEYVHRPSASRREWAQHVQDARHRNVDTILFWSLSDLGCEGTASTLRRLNEFSAAGFQVLSLSEPHFDTTGEFSDIIIAVCRILGKQDEVQLSERVRSRLHVRQSNTRSGRPVGRPTKNIDREKVVELRNQGKSWREVAKACGAGATTVRRAYVQAIGVATLR